MRERYVNVADADASINGDIAADEEVVVSDSVGVMRDDTSGIARKVDVYIIDLLHCCRGRSPVVNANDEQINDDVDVANISMKIIINIMR